MSTISQLKIENTIYNIKDANAARTDHSHSANDITSGTFPISRGGTSVTSNPSMLTNLSSTSADSVFKTSPRPGITGTLGITNGGTGATTAANAATNIINEQAITPASVSATGEISSQRNGITHILGDKIDYLTITPTQEDGDETSFDYLPNSFFMHKGILRKITSDTTVPVGVSISDSWAPQVYLAEEIKKADNITSGIFSVDRIPSLAASKITSGTFSVDRIPSLAASKITSGTFSVDRIPTLPVSKITGAISTSGGTISDGALILSDQNLAIKSTNVNRDASNPSSAADAKNLVFMDNDNDFIGYINVVRETDGRIGLKLAAANEKTDGSTVYNTLKLYVNRAGTTSYEVTNPGAFCNAISAARKSWTQKASLYGNVNGVLSYDLTGCSEVMFVAYYGSVYCGSTILPIDILSTSTQREVYLGGGYVSGSSGRDFAIKATLTQGVIASAIVDGVSQTAMWAVYGR